MSLVMLGGAENDPVQIIKRGSSCEQLARNRVVYHLFHSHAIYSTTILTAMSGQLQLLARKSSYHRRFPKHRRHETGINK